MVLALNKFYPAAASLSKVQVDNNWIAIENEFVNVAAATTASAAAAAASAALADAAAIAAAASALAAQGAVPNVFSATVAALKAINTATTTAVYLYVANRAGQFMFVAGDFTTQAAADVQEFNYIKATAIAVNVGIWVRQRDGNPLDKVAANSLPMGRIPFVSTWNNQLGAEMYWDGSAVRFKAKPYDIIDFTKYTVCNHYYVNWVTGLDTNVGTSSVLAWKTYDKAIATAVTPAVIHLEDDRIGATSAAGSAGKIFSGKLKIISNAPSGRTVFAAMQEAYNLAGFAWAASGANGAYVSGPTAQAKYYRAQFDSKYKDAKGFPRPITNAGTQAACEATTGAGTYFWDVGTSKLYVHMWDGRLPDQADGWLWTQSAYRFELQQALSTNAGVILLENLEFLSNTGTAGGAGCRYRPQTTGAVNTAIYGVKGCLVYGAGGNGFESYDGSITVFENNHVRYCHVDGLNYHSFVTTGTKGEFISVYEYDCSAFDMGYNLFADQTALSNSANGSTSHDSLHTFRANTVVGDCHGAPIADVNGVHSINYNVQSSGPGSTPTFNSCFWHDAYLGAGTTKKMYLWGCSGWDNGDTTVNVLDNTAQAAGAIGDIYVSYWRGQTNGAVIGTLKDFAGNTL